MSDPQNPFDALPAVKEPGLLETALRVGQRAVGPGAIFLSAANPELAPVAALIASLTYEQLGGVAANFAEARLVEGLKGTKEQIAALPEQIKQSEELADATLRTIRNLISESEPDKRTAYKNMYSNFITKQDGKNCDVLLREFNYWSTIVQSISYPTFYTLLKIIQREDNGNPVTYLDETEFFESLSPVITHMYMKAHIIIELEREGFVTELNKPTPNNLKKNSFEKKRFHINPMTKDFLSWINT